MMRKTVFITFVFYVTFSFILMDNSIDAALNIVKREEWGAVPHRSAPTQLIMNPPTHVIVIQTNTAACRESSSCVTMLRQMQNMDMQQYGKIDINHNFIVGGDGKIYEARGWGVQSEEMRQFDVKSIFISFVGDYNKIAPTGAQIEAVQELLKLGVKENKLAKNYKLLAYKQVSFISSPGIHLYNVLKTWKRWTPIP